MIQERYKKGTRKVQGTRIGRYSESSRARLTLRVCGESINGHMQFSFKLGMAIGKDALLHNLSCVSFSDSYLKAF